MNLINLLKAINQMQNQQEQWQTSNYSLNH